MDRKDLQDLSRIRLAEARALLKLNRPDGAFYLAGYALECALKACIAKSTCRGEFPDKRKVDLSHSHNLLQLSKDAGLEESIATKADTDPEFRTNWNLVQLWSEQSRYRRHKLETARAMLNAVGDRSHGVVSWVRKQW